MTTELTDGVLVLRSGGGPGRVLVFSGDSVRRFEDLGGAVVEQEPSVKLPRPDWRDDTKTFAPFDPVPPDPVAHAAKCSGDSMVLKLEDGSIIGMVADMGSAVFRARREADRRGEPVSIVQGGKECWKVFPK